MRSQRRDGIFRVAVKPSFRAKLDMAIGPDSIDAEIPKEHDADCKQLGGIDANLSEQRFEKEMIGRDKDQLVNAQPYQVDEGELGEMPMQGVLETRFGKRPQGVPGEIA